MKPYLIIAKFPKNPSRYIKNFKNYVLDECMKRGIECVVERIQGRILVFASSSPCEFAVQFSGVKRCVPVRIFDDEGSLVSYLIPKVQSAGSFAVRANHLTLSQKIGERIYEATHTPVNLKNPEVLVEFEFRDSRYFLFEN
ncbi:MAG: RNA-binding protein [Euryarchaeota archaeon]|nr:RNA-binding protein [Euryarchaeota archaeon]